MDDNKKLPGTPEDLPEGSAQDTPQAPLPESWTPDETEAVMEGGDLQPCAAQAENEIADELLCEVCGEAERLSAAQPYCAKCREEMLHRKIGWESTIMALVVILLSAAAAALFILQLPVLLLSVKGDFYQKNNRHIDAIQTYSAVESSTKELAEQMGGRLLVTPGRKTNIKLLRSVARGVSPYNAGYYAGQMADEAALKTFLYREAAGYQALFTKDQATEEAMSTLYNDYQAKYPDALPFQEIIDSIDKLKAESGKYNPAYLEFCKFSMAVRGGFSDEKQLEYLKAIETADNSRVDLYLPDMIKIYTRMGDKANALRCADALARTNRNAAEPYQTHITFALKEKNYAEADAAVKDAARYNPLSSLQYELGAQAARMQNKLDDAKKWIADAKTAELTSPELSRQEAIVLLLAKDYAGAFNAAYAAYSAESQASNGQSSIKTFNTLALCAGLAESEDAKSLYTEIENYLKTNGEALPQRIADCIAKKITPEDIFVNGEGDVA